MSKLPDAASRLRPEQVPVLAILLAVAGTVGAYVMVGSPPLVGAEDANIFFRYARNLAEGHGVVFNPGGERVEGITSLLWFGMQAAVYAAVGAANLEVVLTLISILLTAVALGAVMRVLADVAHHGPGLWLGMAWLIAMAGLFLWGGISLMDVGLWAAGVASYVLALLHWMEGRPVRPWVLPSLVVVLSVTRPDALLVIPGIVVVLVLVYGFNRRSLRAAAQVGVTLVGTTEVLVGGRMAYFGYPLPNTYYTKVSPDLVYRLRFGLAYLQDYFVAHPLSLLPTAAALGAFAVSALAMARRRWLHRQSAYAQFTGYEPERDDQIHGRLQHRHDR